jgi:hypothetical protein
MLSFTYIPSNLQATANRVGAMVEEGVKSEHDGKPIPDYHAELSLRIIRNEKSGHDTTLSPSRSPL